MTLFYCIERQPDASGYPARTTAWRRAGPGVPWTTDINAAAQYETREAAQAALEAENWHVDPGAPISVTEHPWMTL